MRACDEGPDISVVVFEEPFTVGDPTFAISVALANHICADRSVVDSIVPCFQTAMLCHLFIRFAKPTKRRNCFLDERQISSTLGFLGKLMSLVQKQTFTSI
jgi:hypothetical protein